MLPRVRTRHALPWVLQPFPWTLWLVLLWFSTAASLPVHGQRADSASPQMSLDAAVRAVQQPLASPSAPAEDSEEEPNPAAAVEPAWVTTWDSQGNLRKRIKVESDFALGDRARLGLLFGQGFVYSTLVKSSVNTQGIRDVGVTGLWHPNGMVKFEGMFGVSQVGATVDTSEQPVQSAAIPITKVVAHITPGGIAKVDLGFNRSIYDLSPQLVANRVVKNEFVVRPEIALSSGWRVRALAEMGPMTSPGKSNARYNSEFTVGRKLGKQSELYSTFNILHYAKASDLGYYSPDLVENMEGGWSTDVDRKALSLSLDFGLGAGHARGHGDSFGPWGVSGHAEAFVTWTVRPGREVRASYEYYYDQSNPAVESSVPTPWHMSVLTLSFRWAGLP